MAENEIEVAGEVSLPFTAKLSVRFKRRWTDRANKFLEDVAAETRLSIPALETRMEQDERLEEVVLEGVAKAGRVADPDYRETLARVVAAAFSDYAKVDEVEQLVGQLLTLDSFTLRVFDQAYHSDSGLGYGKPGSWIVFTRLRAKLPAHPSAVLAAMARLAALGFVSTLVGDTAEVYRWKTTTWGHFAVDLCRRQTDPSDTDSA